MDLTCLTSASHALSWSPPLHWLPGLQRALFILLPAPAPPPCSAARAAGPGSDSCLILWVARPFHTSTAHCQPLLFTYSRRNCESKDSSWLESKTGTRGDSLIWVQVTALPIFWFLWAPVATHLIDAKNSNAYLMVERVQPSSGHEAFGGGKFNAGY